MMDMPVTSSLKMVPRNLGERGFSKNIAELLLVRVGLAGIRYCSGPITADKYPEPGDDALQSPEPLTWSHPGSRGTGE